MRIAGHQYDILLGETERNREEILRRHRLARAAGAELSIFPECALTGYCFESRDAGLAASESLPGLTTDAVIECCSEVGGGVVFGLLERDGDALYNALAFVDGSGIVAAYRKIHLPGLGVDHFVDPGQEPFAVHEWNGVRIGLNICYDAGFPESSRIMMLQGADLIVLPTNWPPGAEVQAEYVTNARAMENRVWYAAVNRVGEEGGAEFIGRSRFCHPDGRTVDSAGARADAMLQMTVDVTVSRQKHIVRRADANGVPIHSIHRVDDRRPDVYGPLVEPHE